MAHTLTATEHAATMADYIAEGNRLAHALGNRGPIKLDDDGNLTSDILEAYWQHGFYVFEAVIGPDELAELRAFLLAKLSWDLDYDVDLGISDFLRAYYGAAAEPLEKYITTMHDAVRASDAPLRIFGSPAEARSSYLADDLVASYIRHFDTAEEAVRDDPELLSRVEITRLPLLYAQLCLEYGERAARRLAVDRFEDIGGSSGLEKVEEWRRTVADFVSETKEKLS